RLEKMRALLGRPARKRADGASGMLAALNAHALASGKLVVDLGAGGKSGPTLLQWWRALAAADGGLAAGGGRALDAPGAAKLPEAGWSYYRVAQPGAFVAGLADLAKRVAAGGVAGSAEAQMGLARAAALNGAKSLADSGMDLDQPFECAVSTDFDES